MKILELYEKASTIITSTPETAHIDIVDMCENEFDHPRCLDCEYNQFAYPYGSFCNNVDGLNGKIDSSSDFCSKHEERK